MNYLQPYLVKWRDIKHESEWKDFDDIIAPWTVTTMGFFIKEEADYYVFCSGFSEDQFYTQDAIPKGTVVSITELSTGKNILGV